MVPQCPMPKISCNFFAGIEPRVKGNRVLDCPAPLLHRGQSVMIGMCHARVPQKSWVYSSDDVNRSLNSRWMDRALASKQNSPYAPPLFSQPSWTLARKS